MACTSPILLSILNKNTKVCVQLSLGWKSRMSQVSRSPNFLRYCSILAVISCLIMRQQSLSGIFLLERKAGFSRVDSFLSALALKAETRGGGSVCEMDFSVLMCSLLEMLLLDLDFFSRPLRWMQSFSFSCLLLLLDSCDRLEDAITLFSTDTLRLLSCILCSNVAVFLSQDPRVEAPSVSDQFLDETSMFFNSRASILPCLWLLILLTIKITVQSPQSKYHILVSCCAGGW